MATPNNAETLIKTASETAAKAVKAAQELNARLERATPKPDLVKAAAEALVDCRWVDTTDVEKVKQAVADPNMALKLLTSIVTQSAEKIASLTKQTNPRLDAGDVVGATAKVAAANGPPPDVALERWNEKIASYRHRTAG